MKIYIAGSSKDIDRCEQAIADARAAGLEITCDWVAAMRENKADAQLTESKLRVFALADFYGVRYADALWLLLPPASLPSSGCWTELGFALALHKIIVCSPPPQPAGVHAASRPQFNIFTTMPGLVHKASDEDALRYLREIGQAVRARREQRTPPRTGHDD